MIILLCHICKKETINLVHWLNGLERSLWTPPLPVQARAFRFSEGAICVVTSSADGTLLEEMIRTRGLDPKAGLQSRRADQPWLLLWEGQHTHLVLCPHAGWFLWVRKPTCTVLWVPG